MKQSDENGGHAKVLMMTLPFLSFAVPFLILYSLDPKSFEATWKGRTYYLFFIWLFLLEVILSWEEIRPKKVKLRSVRSIAMILTLVLPTAYIVVANYYGLNTTIVNLAAQRDVFFAESMPLSIEYLVLMVFFALVIFTMCGINGLKDLSIPTLFLGTIGTLYTIDNLYPYGRFTPFQIIVPTTATLAANVLDLMGFHTRITVKTDRVYGLTPTLEVWDPADPLRRAAGFGIAWPCAGVESLLIYTVTILLFLKKSDISWMARMIYFIAGATVTYLVNILRIVTIYLIALNGGEIGVFHDYYGQLYSITWIICYPLIIIGVQLLWSGIRNRQKNGV